MIARQIHAIFLILAANYAEIFRVLFLYDVSSIPGASVGVRCSDFEHCLIHQQLSCTFVSFLRESEPGAELTIKLPICCGHVLQKKSIFDIGDGSMNVAEVLVVREVNCIVYLPAAVDFSTQRNGHAYLRVVNVGSLNYLKGQFAVVYAVDLELVRTHFNNHTFKQLDLVHDFNKGSSSAADVTNIEIAVFIFYLGMISRDTFLQNQNLIGRMPTNFSSLFPQTIK